MDNFAIRLEDYFNLRTMQFSLRQLKIVLADLSFILSLALQFKNSPFDVLISCQ